MGKFIIIVLLFLCTAVVASIHLDDENYGLALLFTLVSLFFGALAIVQTV